MEAVIIFDADNTLWDTDDVFRSAQLSMLRVLETAGLLDDAGSQIGVLRSVDQELVSRLGQAEYDFGLLSLAMTHFYSQRLTARQAVRAALQHKENNDSPLALVARKAHLAFEKGLKECPRLLPDTEAVLLLIRTFRSVVTVLFSEGNRERLERILEAHSIEKRQLFDAIIIRHKNKEAFEEATQMGQNLLSSTNGDPDSLAILVGDSLHRDIKLGNQAGLITVYKPSAFKGHEVPNGDDERPDHTINTLAEFPSVLEKLGISG